MPFMPFSILAMWLRALLSVAILAGGIYLARDWYDRANVPVTESQRFKDAEVQVPVVPARSTFHPEIGWNRSTAELAAAIALLSFALAGLPIAKGLARLLLRKGDDEPKMERNGEVRLLARPDGSEIHVELYGPADAPPIVLTHGWGANATEWYYTKKHLGGRFRLIAWDLPGLGLSKKPDDNNYSLEKLAADLDIVLALAGDKPALLVGHSIGGMIILTFCRIFPGALKNRVTGLVLVHTTPTNPVRTTKMAGLYTALEKPVLIPLMYLTIWTWPLVWLMNWLAYFNGTAHKSTASESFCGTQTRGQLDFAARFMPQGRPDVLARGMLGMIHYDALPALPGINVPTLVIPGDRDVTTKPEASEMIRSGVPGATLSALSPGKHMGLIEHNDRFDALVGDFADKCQRDRPKI